MGAGLLAGSAGPPSVPGVPASGDRGDAEHAEEAGTWLYTVDFVSFRIPRTWEIYGLYGS